MGAIEWTDATWNPIVGCSIVSPGCTHCYAMRMAARIQRINRTGGSNSNYVNHYDGTTQETKAGPVWTGKVAWAQPKVLRAPLGWKKPRRVFVNSMGDLFHENVPDEWIDRVFVVMGLAEQHTFQVLTKRADRMRDYLAGMEECWNWRGSTADPFHPRWGRAAADVTGSPCAGGAIEDLGFPFPNVHLGVSAERQQEADERIPLLLQTPAAVRFVSAEPLLAPLDLTQIRYHDEDAEVRINALTAEAWVENSDSASAYTDEVDGNTKLDWVIVGGESGPGARPMLVTWARSLRDQCASAKVPFFFKQHGEWIDADEWYRAVGDAAARRPQPLNYTEAARLAHVTGHTFEHQSDGSTVIRVGKTLAGRLLDGVKHDAFPEQKGS